MKVNKEDSIGFQPKRSSNLFLGVVFVVILSGILFLGLRSEQTISKIDNIYDPLDERIGLIEEQLLLLDEVSSDSIGEVGTELQFLDEQIRLLWDLSNKRNKVNIATLTSELTKVNEIIASIQLVIDEVLPQLQQAVGTLNLKTANLDNLEGSTNSIAVDVQQLQRQILFIEESLQALEAYRAQNNQLLLEIQNSINNEESVAVPTSSTNE